MSLQKPSIKSTIKNVFHFFCGIGLTLICTSCATGPDFKRPEGNYASHFLADGDPKVTVAVDGEVQKFESMNDFSSDWWKLFNSQKLNDLVAEGLRHSPKIDNARATLQQSEYDLKAGKGIFYPQIDLGLGFSRQRFSAVGQGIIASSAVFSLYTLSAAVIYSLDVFGADRRLVESLSAQVDVEKANARAVYLALIGNIINTAIAVAAYQDDIKSLSQLIKLQQEQLALIQAQSDAGIVATNNVIAVKSLLSINQANLSILRQRLAASSHLLSTLIGYAPSDKNLPELSLADISLPTSLPISLPTSVAEHRPDILASEATLHVASAKLGVAMSELLPKFTISGDYGFNSQHLGELTDPKSRYWSIGPQMTYPVFHGGTITAQKDSAVAAYEAALANYRQTVLSAFGQIADVLEAIANDAELAAARSQNLRLSEDQKSLVEANRNAGVLGDIDLMLAYQQIESAKINMSDATAQRYQDAVALYVSLGGGWWTSICAEGEVYCLSPGDLPGVDSNDTHELNAQKSHQP